MHRLIQRRLNTGNFVHREHPSIGRSHCGLPVSSMPGCMVLDSTMRSATAFKFRVVEDQGGRPETARPSASLQVCQVLQPRHSFMPLSRASVSRKEMAARPQLRHLSQSLDGSRCLKLSTVCESSASPRLHQSLSSRLSKPTSIKESSEAQKTTTLAFEHTASARAHLTSSPPRRSSSAELLGLLAPAV